MKSDLTPHVLVAVLSIFVLVRIIFIHPSFSDETVYFNMGKQILKGLVPYKDFFFAHPPLQLYLLASVFRFLGAKLVVGKTISLISASMCVLLTYLISKNLYKSNHVKVGFLSAIVFIAGPAFISFSTMGYGMWEASMFVLLSTYVLLKKDRNRGWFLASVLFSTAVFFRYIALLYLPFLFLLLREMKIKIKKFAIAVPTIMAIFFLICMAVFGEGYLNQTIYYHVFSKASMVAPVEQRMQYLNMGFFSIFLALLSLSIAYQEKDRKLAILSMTALLPDMLMLIGLKLVFYHYFIISLPFYSMVAGISLISSKDRLVKIIIAVIISLSILSNLQTIDFHINPKYANRFYEISDLVQSETLENETIFGEPVMTNYISLITGREIAANYLDSYIRHLMFEGTEKAVEKIMVDQPKILIEMENYYLTDPNLKDLFDDYILEKAFSGVPNYLVYAKN